MMLILSTIPEFQVGKGKQGSSENDGTSDVMIVQHLRLFLTPVTPTAVTAIAVILPVVT